MDISIDWYVMPEDAYIKIRRNLTRLFHLIMPAELYYGGASYLSRCLSEDHEDDDVCMPMTDVPFVRSAEIGD